MSPQCQEWNLILASCFFPLYYFPLKHLKQSYFHWIISTRECSKGWGRPPYPLSVLWLHWVLMHWGSASCRLGSMAVKVIGSWCTSQLGFLHGSKEHSTQSTVHSDHPHLLHAICFTVLRTLPVGSQQGQQGVCSCSVLALTCSRRWSGSQCTRSPPVGTHRDTHTRSVPSCRAQSTGKTHQTPLGF